MSVIDGVEETTEREVRDADTLHHSPNLYRSLLQKSPIKETLSRRREYLVPVGGLRAVGGVGE